MIKTGTVPTARIADSVHAELQSIRTKVQEAKAELGTHYGHLTEIKRAIYRLNDLIAKLQAQGYDINAIGEAFTNRYQAGSDWTTDVRPFIQNIRNNSGPALVSHVDGLMDSGVLSPVIEEDGGRRYKKPMSRADQDALVPLLDAVLANFE